MEQLNLLFSGIGALATAAAVLVALFLPWFQNKKTLKNILHVLKDELANNEIVLNEAKNIPKGGMIVNGIKLQALALYFVKLDHLSVEIWRNHSVQLATLSAKDFSIARDLYANTVPIRNIIDANYINMDQERPPTPQLELIAWETPDGSNYLEEAIKMFTKHGPWIHNKT